jgi:predicted transcriptional regulator
MEFMPSTNFTLRVDSAVKKRLEKLAKNTGRSRSFLAAEAIAESFLSTNGRSRASRRPWHLSTETKEYRTNRSKNGLALGGMNANVRPPSAPHRDADLVA